MGRRLFTPSHRPLVVPGTNKRVLRRPDLRSLLAPARPSGAPLSPNEQDWDDLVIYRSWRAYEPDRPGEVRYFMYEFAQKDPGAADWWFGFKAVRLIRLTRVPRYLRASNSHAGPNLVFEQMRDVLAALREQQTLFVQMVAKSPQLPMVFAYGVQAVGATPEEAMERADESYAVLNYQLAGTYQQLQYKPLTVEEGELIARYQVEWDNLAVARGRPLPVGSTLNTGALLTDARTDVESTNNQLESFIRGMSDKSFMLTMVTVPLSPAEMTVAWRNITQKLSDVRSDQEGSRSVSAGVSLPLQFGQSLGDTSGSTHTAGASHGQGTSAGVSHSLSQSVSQTHGISTSHSDAAGVSATQSHGVSASVSASHAQSLTNSLSHAVAAGSSASHGTSVAQGQSVSASHSTALGTSTSHATGHSLSQTQGASQAVAVGHNSSISHGTTASQGESIAAGQSIGTNQSVSTTQSNGASTSGTEGLSQSQANGVSQSINLGSTNTNGVSTSTGSSGSSTVHGGVPGIGGGTSTGHSSTDGNSSSNAGSVGVTQSGTGTNTIGTNQSLTQGLSQSISLGQTQGVSNGHSLTDSQSIGASQSLSATDGMSTTQSQGLSSALSQGVSTSDGAGQSLSQGAALSQGASLTTGANNSVGSNISQSAGVGQSAGMSDTVGQAQGTSAAVSQGQSYTSTDSTGVSASSSQGTTDTSGTSQGASAQQALSDAYAVAMSRATSVTSALGVIPTIGVMLSRVTRDEAKRIIGDILEAQMLRYAEGYKSGAFLYQMFLVTPDRENLVGGAALLKSAFWGAGGPSDQVPQPFHVLDRFSDDPEFDMAERERMLAHARVFTSYRRREPVAELIEPFKYSSYLTPTEGAAFCHPPTAEALGIKAVWDSMPVFAMPHDRARRDIKLGHVVNGERAQVTDQVFGIDIDEMTHALMVGVTGAGKTTTLMRFLTEAARVTRTVTTRPSPTSPVVSQKQVKTSILGLDWMPNMRNLAAVVEPDRFRFYSLIKPELGRFRWNLLAIPTDSITPTEWLNAQADNFTAAMSLGEYGRSLIAELLTDLYMANRLEPTVLLPDVVDQASGAVLRPGVVLPAVDPNTLPPGAIRADAKGNLIANVMSCPALSRLVSMEHLAALVVAKVEKAATVDGARQSGTAMRDRIQSLWRRMSYYAPGGQFEDLLGCDPDLNTKTCLTVTDLVDPDRGMVSIIETDGLDQANRRLILGSILMAVYRYGLAHGKGTFDHDGAGPGTFVVLEEAHELFREEKGEDTFTVATRNSLYESMFRRARALGLRLIAVAQNPGSLPEAVTSNTSTVFVQRVTADADRKVVASLLNWSNQVTGNLVEMRFLGMMPTGYTLVRLQPRDSWLEAAPVLMLTDPPAVREVSDAELKAIAARR